MLAVVVLLGATGCATFRPIEKSPEYEAARREVEGYEGDREWSRPEGVKAESKKSRSVSAAIDWIPGIDPAEPDREKARTLFLEGDTLFEKAKNSEGDERRDNFRAAMKKYKAAAKAWPSSWHEQDSLIMAGESAFFAEDYPDAEEFYVRLVKEYPRTRYLELSDQRRMEIALYWLRYDAADPKAFYEVNLTDARLPWNDTDGHAIRVLDKLRLDNPTGKLADDVTMELATEAFRKANYQDARDTFEDLRITYPDSPHQFDAHFLGLKAALETYQGPQYPQEPIDEGEELIKKMVKQFPAQAKEQQEFLNRAFAEIRYKKAERLYDQAEFRLKRGENTSAKIYLDQLLTEYSDTPFAEQARADTERIKDLPGEPVRYFQWLDRLFPESSRTRPLLESKPDNG